MNAQSEPLILSLSTENADRYRRAYRLGLALPHPQQLGKFVKLEDFYEAYEEGNKQFYGLKMVESEAPESGDFTKVRIEVTGGPQGFDTQVNIYDATGKKLDLAVSALQLNFNAGKGLNEAVVTLHNFRLDLDSEFDGSSVYPTVT